MEPEALKNYQDYPEKIISKNLNMMIDYPSEHYPLKSFVYHPGLFSYFQVKKYDEDRLVYLLKPLKSSDNSSNSTDLEAPHEALSD
jgi:hypothetical protein